MVYIKSVKIVGVCRVTTSKITIKKRNSKPKTIVPEAAPEGVLYKKRLKKRGP